jgi:hypothetical protein
LAPFVKAGNKGVRRLALALLVLASAGCSNGGGGSGAVGSGCTAGYTTSADTTVEVGKAAGAAVASTCGALTNVAWTQTAGPAVALLAAKAQAISFEPVAAGTYTFRVDFRDSAQAPRSATVSIATQPAINASRVVVRADQAVRAGGGVSLRAWPQLAAGDSVVAVGWEQLAGPAVTLDRSVPLRVIFTAPNVERDTVLRLRATLTTMLGTVDSDDVLVLVEAHRPGTASQYLFAGTHVSRVYPYRAGGPYAGVLARCVADADLQWTGAGKNLCALSTLPFLAQDTGGAAPSVAQVMDRVVVSHDWMGDVFEQFLTAHDASGDFRRLLNGVTAIVIGAHVRPSFYYAVTGAIYLDAENFWLTPAQRDVIDELPDYRSDFDRDLAYSSLWRYTRTVNGVARNIFLPFPRDQRNARDINYLLDETGWLLYHELAHASDFLPPAARGTLDGNGSPWDNIGPRYAARQLPSDQLADLFPLTSGEVRGLAQVKFLGASATQQQRDYTPQQVAGFFSLDRATDEYNYATTYEDIAMLFEEFMQAHRHGIRRDFAITDKVGPGTSGDTLAVRWGSRGRIADDAVKPRIKAVLAQLAPWIADPAAAVDALPAPLAMRAGDSWNANLALPAPPRPAALVLRPAAGADDRWLLERALRRAHVIAPAR